MITTDGLFIPLISSFTEAVQIYDFILPNHLTTDIYTLTCVVQVWVSPLLFVEFSWRDCLVSLQCAVGENAISKNLSKSPYFKWVLVYSVYINESHFYVSSHATISSGYVEFCVLSLRAHLGLRRHTAKMTLAAYAAVFRDELKRFSSCTFFLHLKRTVNLYIHW